MMNGLVRLKTYAAAFSKTQIRMLITMNCNFMMERAMVRFNKSKTNRK